MVSVWAGAAWILVWGQQECPAAGQSFFSKNVTEIKVMVMKPHVGAGISSCPSFHSKTPHKTFFIELLLCLGTVLSTEEDRMVNKTDCPALMWSCHFRGGDGQETNKRDNFRQC